MQQVASSCSGQVHQPERTLPTPTDRCSLTDSAKTFSDRAAISYELEGWPLMAGPRPRSTMVGFTPAVRCPGPR